MKIQDKLVNFQRFLVFPIFLLFCHYGHAQMNVKLTFNHSELTDGKILELEAFEYKPSKWNGKVILMSHGSTGGVSTSIKNTYNFSSVAKEATNNGYIFITYMRKGRGKSEGVFTEETGRCDKLNLAKERREAELQTEQVINQVTQLYGVQKVLLFGHSRGGFLSATYAGKNADKVLAVVNLAGAWSAVCENKNGAMGRAALDEASRKFKPQYWFYFERDSFFTADKFNDPDYKGLSEIAERNGVKFFRVNNYGVADGHATPLVKPWTWTKEAFSALESLN